MKIGIDASRYNHEQATGVEWYSWHIINGIIQEMLNNHSAEIILYSKEPIEPKSRGFVKATYNAANVGQFTKTVSVNANTEGGIVQLTIKGEVVQ